MADPSADLPKPRLRDKITATLTSPNYLPFTLHPEITEPAERQHLDFFYKSFGPTILSSFFPDGNLRDLDIWSYRSRFIDGKFNGQAEPTFWYLTKRAEIGTTIDLDETNAGVTGYTASVLFQRRFPELFNIVLPNFIELQGLKDKKSIEIFIQQHFLPAFSNLSKQYPAYAQPLKQGLSQMLKNYGFTEIELKDLESPTTTLQPARLISNIANEVVTQTDRTVSYQELLDPVRVRNFVNGLTRSADSSSHINITTFGKGIYLAYAQPLLMEAEKKYPEMMRAILDSYKHEGLGQGITTVPYEKSALSRKIEQIDSSTSLYNLDPKLKATIYGYIAGALLSRKTAEEAGFEPAVTLPPHTLSRRAD